jgi:CHAT domain-containing protein/Tfp pilus assembly protein PilF
VSGLAILLTAALSVQPLPEGIATKLALARQAWETGNPDRAIEHYRVALESAEGAAAAAIEGLLAEALKTSSRYQEALSHQETGLRKLNASLNPGGKRYRTDGGEPIAPDVYECDRSRFEEILATLDNSSTGVLAACLMMNAGSLYLQQLQLDSARDYYERALEATQDASLELRAIEVRTNLAWLEILERRPDAAARWLENARERLPSNMEFRRTYLVLGVLFRETGRLIDALFFLDRASRLYQDAQDWRGYSRSLAHLGTLYLSEGRFTEARASYEKALLITGDDEARWHALGGLAKCLLELGDVPGALRRYEQYLETVNRLGTSFATDQGKVSFLANHQGVLEEYLRVLVLDASSRGRFDEARTAVETARGRTLVSLMLARESTPRPVRPGELVWSELLREKPLPNPGGADSPVQMAPGIPSLPDEPVAENPVPGERSRPVTPPTVTFLEYYSFPDRTAIFVKSTDGAVHGATVPFGADALSERVARFRKELGVQAPRGIVLAGEESASEASEDWEALRAELYRILIEPIEASLPADPDDVVVIVPHRALWYLPFAALGKTGTSFFIDRHLLTMAASEGSWLVTARRAREYDHRRIRAWIAGNPRMPDRLFACGREMSFEPLPGAENEARRITSILGTERSELFVGASADRLRFEAWHGDFSVIHLATHGVVCESDPLDSFLVLSDLDPADVRIAGAPPRLSLRLDSRRPVTLTGVDPGAAKVARLDLSGVLTAHRVIEGLRLRADLVSLSACQTGLGQLSSEGILGFSRAFLAAGARSLLMSLWRIDDLASRDWMTAFYEEYASHGNKARALARAMERTRETYPEPRYWAGFGLLGLAE